MSRLPFSGQGRYPEYSAGYALYKKRSRKETVVDEIIYRRVVKAYCKALAEEIYKNGMVDLPGRCGMISTATITRRPQYRGDKFIGFGKMDWERGCLDGTYKAFGIVYMPRHDRNSNLRSCGFVANRRLFQRVKGAYEERKVSWIPLEFSDSLI